ncbi:MAG: mechanosensitive ion channel family protein [Leptospiraceae bacterium]|nr:mechanosensitive ion channel family protein [Leptospiraceae bacterium]MDW7976176.1 mechanosensitive ion channel family protein [Leptospiraceae bacterium]
MVKFILDLSLNFVYVLVIISFFLIIRKYVLNLIKKKTQDPKQQREYKIYVDYTFLFLVILFSLPIFLPTLKELITFIGIFGAGILLVFKEIFLGISAFFYIILRKPFKIGDRIRIHDYYGDVIDIRLVDFTMLQLYPQNLGGQSSGRIVSIPNSLIYSYPLVNFSKEFSFNWLEIKIPLTIDSDWKKAETLSLEIVNEIVKTPSEDDERILMSHKEYSIYFTKLTPKVFVEFTRGSILLSVRFLCEPKIQRNIQDLFWREFLKKIQDEKTIKLKDNVDLSFDF